MCASRGTPRSRVCAHGHQSRRYNPIRDIDSNDTFENRTSCTYTVRGRSSAGELNLKPPEGWVGDGGECSGKLGDGACLVRRAREVQKEIGRLTSNPRSAPYRSPASFPSGPVYQTSDIPTTAPATPKHPASTPATPSGRLDGKSVNTAPRACF